MLRKLSGAALMLFAVLPILAQPAGRGVIVEINPSTSMGIGALNPLACDVGHCLRVVDWLYPTLFATDPVGGAVVPASPENTGLVVDPLLSSDQTQPLTLRGDLFWSDGTPVTAYDALYSAVAYFSVDTAGERQALTEMDALTVTDSRTLTIAFAEPDCAAPAQMNFQVLPAHVYSPGFAARVDAFLAGKTGPLTLREWRDSGVVSNLNGAFDPSVAPVTAGEFEFESLRPFESVRLKSGDTGYVYADLPDGAGEVENFLAGGSTYIVNPPLNRRADLLAKPELRSVVYPSGRWLALTFNFADPDHPRSAFNDAGELRDQGTHPVMSDLAVRQAIRLAIDVDEIIDLAYQGYAQPLASMWPPSSWAHDPSRERTPFDFRAAQDVLQAAGWRDSNRDGVRECRECAAGNIGAQLYVSFSYASRGDRVADLIARQLQRVGFGVGFQGDPSAQNFGLYLGAYATPPTADPDISRWFMREYDRVGRGETAPNYGSYYDAGIERLFTEARTVPACDIAARRDLYGQIQDIFDAEVVTIPLLVESDMIFAQPSVSGLAPLPAHPLWNIRDWVVTP